MARHLHGHDADRIPASGAGAPGADPASRQQIADEHRALRSLLATLAETTDPHELLRRLERLRDLLRDHFRTEEEAGGFHDMVGDTAPHLLTTVQRLFEEHRAFTARVDELILDTRTLIDGPVAEVRAGVGDLARQLHEHEASENELVAWALYEDLGISS